MSHKEEIHVYLSREELENLIKGHLKEKGYEVVGDIHFPVVEEWINDRFAVRRCTCIVVNVTVKEIRDNIESSKSNEEKGIR